MYYRLLLERQYWARWSSAPPGDVNSYVYPAVLNAENPEIKGVALWLDCTFIMKSILVE